MELRGKTILITRAASQSEELRKGLEKLGARVIECPAIEIVPIEDWKEVDEAIGRLDSYDWLILTSTNAVDHFMQRVTARGSVCKVPIAVVGPATARKLTEWNLTAAQVPASFRAEGLLEMFPLALNGVRILFPRAESARELLPEELCRRGAQVDVVAVYRTVKSEAGLSNLHGVLDRERIDCVAFTSPSAVRHFAEALGEQFTTKFAGTPIAVIGPIAREAVEAVGLKAEIQPAQATIPDLVDAITAYFR